MTSKELKEKIAESSNFEWFQKYKINLNYPKINYVSPIKGAATLYDFILKQIEGFNKYEELPKELDDIKKAFEYSRDRVKILISNNNADINQWNNDLSRVSSNYPVKFLSDSPETELLVKVYHDSPSYYSGVYQYLIGNTQHVTDKDHLIGYLLAYEFTAKDVSKLAKRIDVEKKSMDIIRGDFQKNLEESDTHLTDYLAQANQKYIKYSDKIDEFQNAKEGDYNNWFEKISNELSQFKIDSDKKIKELEELYKEKLKLEAPAKYWSDRAKKLRTEGYWWLGSLITMVVGATVLLVWSLSEISNGVLAKIFQNNGTAIKWSVVFITLISFIAFAIRIFSKLTFSSFHLVRDAEEREQLTYVYLALQKEKGIDETERHLIMQSLFSRADTGLLKDDAGPTMPGSIADKIITR